ncbi:MAG TPA: hypothetical protein VKG91_09555 [Roseiarcus sp.]|nr:hypothetical protein [Roseiarcus sp.]
MKADRWEIMTTDSDVQDYGTSDFKGRPLDTAFARVTIRLKNAILGEYKDACFVFGRIAYAGRLRDPLPRLAKPSGTQIAHKRKPARSSRRAAKTRGCGQRSLIDESN